MEACILVCRTQKSKIRKGKVLFINAINEVTRERAQSFLTEEHQSRILKAYQSETDIPGLSRHVPNGEIMRKRGSLSMSLYFESDSAITTKGNSSEDTLEKSFAIWNEASGKLAGALSEILSYKRVTPKLALKPVSDLHKILVNGSANWRRLKFHEFANYEKEN